MTATAAKPQAETPDPVAEDLRAIVAALADPRQRIETAFVDVGGRLTEAAGLLGRVSSLFEGLPRDLESEELVEATGRLEAVGSRAYEIAAAFSTEREDIARLLGVVTAADQPISDLRKAVKMMEIVAINARVAAAGIVGRMEGFDVFTTDIAALSDSAAKTIRDFSLVYEHLTRGVERAAEQRAHFEAAHQDTLTGLAERLGRNLAAVVQRRQQSASSSAETGRMSRDIANRIATAVSALQVGDATRQRVEHVEDGLTRLAEIMAGSGEHDVPPAALPATAAAVTRLAAAQLADTGAVFSLEVEEADDALRQLAVDARAIMDHSREVYGEANRAGASPLAVLNADLREAVAVLADCEAERGKLDGLAAAVAETVEKLLTYVEAVQDIEANMRLVSLNAAVKCAQLGPRGRALDVIAQQLRQLTGETVVAAEAAMTNLKQAAELAKAFSRAASGDTARQVGALEQEARASMALLETVDKRLSEALAVLTKDGGTAVSRLAAAATGFSDHAAIAAALSESERRVAALCGDAEGEPDAALLQLLRKRYTMGSERQVHDRLFPAAAAEEEQPPMPASEEAELDALFF
jgi:hypothetical protein